MVLAGAAFGLVMIGGVVLVVTQVSSIFADPTATANTDNISFDVGNIQDSKRVKDMGKTRSLNEVLEISNSAVTGIKTQKEISFGIDNNKSTNSTENIQAAKVSGSESSFDALNRMMGSRSPGVSPTRLSLVSQRAETTGVNNSNPSSKKNSEADSIKKQIARIYETEGREVPESVREKPTSASAIEERRSRMMSGVEYNTPQSKPAQSKSSYRCVVHGTQTLRENSTITLRLIETAATDDGFDIPRNTILHGFLRRSSNDRLSIAISRVTIGNKVHPFSYKVYALDGHEGVDVQGSDVQNKVSNEISNTASREINKIASKNILTQTAASVANIVTSQVKRDKEIEVTLIDNIQFIITK